MKGRGRRTPVALMLIGLALFAIFGLWLLRSDRPQNTESTQKEVPSKDIAINTARTNEDISQSRRKEPQQVLQVSNDLLRPYDLLKNPFMDKGKLVRFNPLDVPIVADGMPVRYDPIAPQAARRGYIKGLRFDRMLSANVALFDIMGIEPMESTSLQMEGQLVVLLGSDVSAPGDMNLWNVEPIGTVTGTNAFGAQIEVPAIRFISYANNNPTRDTQMPELTGNALRAVNLVRKRIEPTAALLQENPDLNDAEWHALNNKMLCVGCWFVSAHIRIHANSTSPMQYYVNPGWEVNLQTRALKPDADAIRFYQSDTKPIPAAGTVTKTR